MDMNGTSEQIKARITATHCCVCNSPLTDSTSIETGLGPVCSKRYYAPVVFPTQEQIERVLGQLYKLVGEKVFPDDLFQHIVTIKGDARMVANTLLRYTSTHYDKRDIVLSMVATLRELGYKELASRLEIDRIKARIEEVGDNLELWVVLTTKSQADLRKIAGSQPVVRPPKDEGESLGKKVGWLIPKSQLDHLMVVLGVHFFGDLYAFNGLKTIPRHSRNELFKFFPRTPEASQTASSLGMRTSSKGIIELMEGPTQLRVRTPYLPVFKDELKNSVPKSDIFWDGCWVVKATHLGVVKALIQKHFGVDFDAAP